MFVIAAGQHYGSVITEQLYSVADPVELQLEYYVGWGGGGGSINRAGLKTFHNWKIFLLALY